MKIFTYSYFMFVLFCSNLVFGQTSDAASDVRSLMESRDQQIKHLTGLKERTIQALRDEKRYDGIIDFTEMAKTALEVTYGTISVAERTELAFFVVPFYY